MKSRFIFSLLLVLTMCFSNVMSAYVKTDQSPGIEMKAIIKDCVTLQIVTTTSGQSFIVSKIINQLAAISDWSIKQTILNTKVINLATVNPLYILKESYWSKNHISYNFTNTIKTLQPKFTSTFRSPRDSLRAI